MTQDSVSPLILFIDLTLLFGVTLGLSLWVSRTHRLRFWEPVRGAGRTSDSVAAATEHDTGVTVPLPSQV